MGRAKAWLPWFGHSMIEHVVDCLAPAVDEVVVVTSAELDLPPLRADVVSDRAPELGPLAAIREGLAAAAKTEAEYAFVTSVDAPHLSTEFVEEMFAFGMAAAPIAEDRVQVLSAIYPCAGWKKADELLSQGVRRPRSLLEELDYKPIEWASATRPSAPPAWSGFNTPAEYLDAVRSRDPDATAEVELLGRAARKAQTSRYRLPVATLGELLSQLPESGSLIADGRVAKSHLVSLGGRDLVRDLAVPVGPGENVSVIDALAGG
jgi:molybdopterin-guanine dinucleotide biosynthesis protein A